jgi:pyruvate,water dikinase
VASSGDDGEQDREDRLRQVRPLSEVRGGDLGLAGGKGANLGELVSLGLPVPRGFVVLTSGYRKAVADAGLAEWSRAEGELRSAIEAIDVPAELRHDILAAYDEIGGGPVAVRSSATAEDLPGATFAGQQDTYLGVVGPDAVVDAVKRCWASLWSDRAVDYRRKRSLDSTEVAIAVVVQKMVPAQTAGVLFTANPVSGRRDELVVEASSGLGEAVVSGLVTPDRYLLDPSGALRDWRAGAREVVITSDTAGGTTTAAGTAPTEPTLPTAALVRLADLGSAVARHFGRPQDIEWAYADGEIALLQARPMTALPPPPMRLNRLQRIFAAFFVEMLTVRPYPLDVSSWLAHGPLRMVERMADSAGLRMPELAKILPEQDGVVTHLVPPTPRPTIRVLGTPLRVLRRVLRFDPARWQRDPRFLDYQARMDNFAVLDVAQQSWSELLRAADEVMDLSDVVTQLRIDYLPRAGLQTLRLRLVLALLGRLQLAPGLMAGTRTRTSDANDALSALADRIRSDARLRRLLEADELATDPEFGAELAEFLREYGHRETVSPLLVSAPTWQDSPAVVMGLLKALVDGPPAKPVENRAQEELLAHRMLRGERLRGLVLRAVENARTAIAVREDTHFYLTRPLPVLRRVLLELGRRLVVDGVLDTPEEVFHLRLEELRAGERSTTGLRSAVLARAVRRDELAGVRMFDRSAVFPATEDGESLVVGTGASGGSATGPVRVIHDASGFGSLRTGEILVCGYTNPAWTPLFRRAAAVVVDTGGIASHAAIVAREYGIPAVMGTVDATTRLTDGQLVTVDGDRGRVVAAHREQ